MSQMPPQGRRGAGPGRVNASRDPRHKPHRRVRQRADVSGMVDVHIRIGLDSHVVRLKEGDYMSKLVMAWQLGGEDVLLRAGRESSERQIVLRGSSGGMLTIRQATNTKKVPLYTIMTVNEAKEQITAQYEQAAHQQE